MSNKVVLTVVRNDMLPPDPLQERANGMGYNIFLFGSLVAKKINFPYELAANCRSITNSKQNELCEKLVFDIVLVFPFMVSLVEPLQQ